MTHYLISEAATLLGVSPDTVRRWVSAGKLPAEDGPQGRKVIEGRNLAEFSEERAQSARSLGDGRSSARNRAEGLVTRIQADKVMAQVDIQCGPLRFVSLMSREAVEDLNLQVGDLAHAVVKATTVIVEVPK